MIAAPSNLDEKPHERPVDRLHAIGAVQVRATQGARREALLVPLGRLLFPYIEANCDRWEYDCINGLAEALQWKENRLNLRKEYAFFVAKQALLESRHATCTVCKGITDIPDGITSIPDVEKMAGKTEWDGPVPLKPCPACKGTGKRLWTDPERAEVVGDAARFDKAFSTAHALISEAIGEALRPYRTFLKD